MGKKLIHKFNIKIANSNTKVSKTFTKVSRKCLATIIKINGVFKAKISLLKKNETDYLVIDLTPKSLDLKGKTHVFSTKFDDKGRHILIIRDIIKAYFHPGLNNQYVTVKEGCVVSGHIMKCNGKMYFEYEELIAFSEHSGRINETKIITDTPLFKDESSN